MSLELAPDPRLRKAGPLGTGAEKEQRQGDDERDEPACLEGQDGRVAHRVDRAGDDQAREPAAARNGLERRCLDPFRHVLKPPHRTDFRCGGF